jgi:hypothetical protein
MDRNNRSESLDNFVPDPAHIKALPKPLKKYIHDLATRADPAGDVAAIACLRKNVQGLTVTIDSARKELQDLCMVWRCRNDSTWEQAAEELERKVGELL